MTTILSLPKDVLAMVFSQLWRIEARGVPLTCKLFHQVISSQRSNFRHFTITIQVTSAISKHPSIHVAQQNAETFILEYDHFDTLSSLLSKVQNKESSSTHMKSLYAYAHGRMVAFYENNLVSNELEQLGPSNRAVLYTSPFTWKESRNRARTWCDFVNEGSSSGSNEWRK